MYRKIKSTLAVALLTVICSSPFAAQLINVNTADVVTLAENLNGIGSAKAKAIVEYRKLHGDFQGVEDLIKVKGIGSKLVERNSEFISFGQLIPGNSVAAPSNSAQSTTSIEPVTEGKAPTTLLPASN